jgi:hypothetical protein
MVDWSNLKLLAGPVTGCKASMWRVGRRVGLARQGADMPAAGRNRPAPCSPHFTLLGWRAGHELERTVTPGQTFTRTVSRAAVGQVGGLWAAGYVNQLDPRACHWQKADRLPVGVRSQLGACLKLPRSAAGSPASSCPRKTHASGLGAAPPGAFGWKAGWTFR